MQNTHFLRPNQAASKSPGPVARTLKTKIKKISKFFSLVEVLPMRGSRGKLRKSLESPCDWTFQPRTSRQTESRETKNPKFENILSIFRDWGIGSPVSREKSLCGLATGTCDQTNPRLSCQNRTTLFLKFLTFLQGLSM